MPPLRRVRRAAGAAAAGTKREAEENEAEGAPDAKEARVWIRTGAEGVFRSRFRSGGMLGAEEGAKKVEEKERPTHSSSSSRKPLHALALPGIRRAFRPRGSGFKAPARAAPAGSSSITKAAAAAAQAGPPPRAFVVIYRQLAKRKAPYRAGTLVLRGPRAGELADERGRAVTNGRETVARAPDGDDNDDVSGEWPFEPGSEAVLGGRFLVEVEEEMSMAELETARKLRDGTLSARPSKAGAAAQPAIPDTNRGYRLLLRGGAAPEDLRREGAALKEASYVRMVYKDDRGGIGFRGQAPKAGRGRGRPGSRGRRGGRPGSRGGRRW